MLGRNGLKRFEPSAQVRVPGPRTASYAGLSVSSIRRGLCGERFDHRRSVSSCGDAESRRGDLARTRSGAESNFAGSENAADSIGDPIHGNFFFHLACSSVPGRSVVSPTLNGDHLRPQRLGGPALLG